MMNYSKLLTQNVVEFKKPLILRFFFCCFVVLIDCGCCFKFWYKAPETLLFFREYKNAWLSFSKWFHARKCKKKRDWANTIESAWEFWSLILTDFQQQSAFFFCNFKLRLINNILLSATLIVSLSLRIQSNKQVIVFVPTKTVKSFAFIKVHSHLFLHTFSATHIRFQGV